MNRLRETAGEVNGNVGIQDTLQAYETALNASDTDAALALFANDGVFMAPNNPSALGHDAIRAAYDGIFAAIGFATELTVAEIVTVAPDWAFVRTSSNGFVTVRAIDQRVPDANHELFVFNRDRSGLWKIARYAFSSTLPAAG